MNGKLNINRYAIRKQERSVILNNGEKRSPHLNYQVESNNQHHGGSASLQSLMVIFVSRAIAADLTKAVRRQTERQPSSPDNARVARGESIGVHGVAVSLNMKIARCCYLQLPKNRRSDGHHPLVNITKASGATDVGRKPR